MISVSLPNGDSCNDHDLFVEFEAKTQRVPKLSRNVVWPVAGSVVSDLFVSNNADASSDERYHLKIADIHLSGVSNPSSSYVSEPQSHSSGISRVAPHDYIGI